MQRILELAQETGLSVDEARALLEQFSPAEGTCRVCGCTDSQACVDELGAPCYWASPGLCSECAAADADAYGALPDKPLVQSYTDGDLNGLLARRGVA
jgi:hypothetical protein